MSPTKTNPKRNQLLPQVQIPVKTDHSLIDSIVELLEKGWNPITHTNTRREAARPPKNPISNLS